MRTKIILLASVAMMVCLSGCQKEEKQTIRFSGTIEQCTNSESPKMTYDGNGLQWTANNWSTGDMIGFRASNWDNWWIGAYATPRSGDPGQVDFDYSGFAGAEEVSTSIPPYQAWFPAEINSGGQESYCTLPGQQRDFTPSNFAMPMFATTNSTEFHFRNLCGLVKIHLPATNCTVNRIILTTDTPINGAFNIGGTASEPTLNYRGGGLKSTVMYHTVPDDCSGGKDFYIYLPAGTYGTMTFTIIQPNGDYCIKTGHNIVVLRSKYSTVNIASLSFVSPSTSATNGRLPGLFTVNSNGDQVYFSQGNLQYRASDNVWRFGLRQYDFVGDHGFGTVFDGSTKSHNYNISATYTGWIDLFGWGTSGWNNGNAYYRPYDTQWGSEASNNYGYGPTDGTSVFSLTGAYANADWGVHNPIANGGNQAGLWRTPTYDELNYIVFGRPNALAKCLFASVSGIPGIVLLPDNWTAPAGADLTDNVYNPLQWEAMEAAGAVFLPEAGMANGYRDNPCELTDAHYWTSTCDYQFEANIGAFIFYTHGIGTQYQAKPEGRMVMMGFYIAGMAGSVRLVQDAE